MFPDSSPTSDIQKSAGKILSGIRSIFSSMDEESCIGIFIAHIFSNQIVALCRF